MLSALLQTWGAQALGWMASALGKLPDPVVSQADKQQLLGGWRALRVCVLRECPMLRECVFLLTGHALHEEGHILCGPAPPTSQADRLLMEGSPAEAPHPPEPHPPIQQ